MIKGMIFDLDGTTLYTLKDLQTALNMTMKEFGVRDQTLEETRLHIGKGIGMLVRQSFPEDTDEETIAKAIKRFSASYSEVLENTTRPYEGIGEVLEELQKRGIKLAINSNKNNEPTLRLIQDNFPKIEFVAIIGAREGIPNKPDPHSANEIVDMMGLEKAEVLYIGDSESDMKTATNAGLRSVGCLWGYRDAKILQEAGADILVARPEEILDLI